MVCSSKILCLVTFGNEVTEIRKYYVFIFVYILQGKIGEMVKNWKENHATKVTKIPKNQKTKIWDKRNIRIFAIFLDAKE